MTKVTSFIAGTLLLVANYAQAGSLIISATPGGLTKTQTLTDAEVSRVIAWAKASYGQICAGEPVVCRDRTNAEAFDAVATGIFRGIRDNVLNYERELARKPVSDTVLPIGVP